jgi:hypothetical protein
VLGCDIYITTRQLTVVSLNEEWEQLLELIWKLHTDGMENKEIAHFLNSHGYKPRRTENFYGNSVWGILKKYSIGKRKKEELDIRFKNIGFYKRMKKEIL